MTVNWDADKTYRIFEEEITKAVSSGIEAVRLEAVRSMLQDPKTGRVYNLGIIRHQASAPGETPAILSGQLSEDTVIEVFKRDGEVTGELTFKAPHASHMEYGAPNAGIAPRPFAVVSLLKMTPRFNSEIEEAVKRAGQRVEALDES